MIVTKHVGTAGRVRQCPFRVFFIYNIFLLVIDVIFIEKNNIPQIFIITTLKPHVELKTRFFTSDDVMTSKKVDLKK